mmetsp:Transcript_44006/g.65270  ORF Transcript_44006/g.65270 Transcript_44006/m.65270 type:complete len:116 (-) Transcript_44006:321-668(-)|eukprot:CAMPEP_0194048866 /NCGR_PEP_ID=MMETSP0009_2-20130614/28795_1 /TAXON_ID=210454 /ORGANISM="Grammatophora oceanica, Strain CCMP 410" /LENGTH=115 /DNA_ID=CAMNT_0038694873 /DNA_START=92 /DNA_END=439 /DNA_ORIENTATION=+
MPRKGAKALGDKKHRAETKQEKAARLQATQEAREQCHKLLPYILGCVLLMVVAFGAYVRSIPPKAPKAASAPLTGTPKQEAPSGAKTDFKVDLGEGEDGGEPEPKPVENMETIEL